MKTVKIKNMKTRLFIVLISVFVIACSSNNKQAQLTKLKSQRVELDEQIKKLEDDIKNEKGNALNTDKFKFVGVSEVKSGPFDHFIRVQGKLDGDSNAEVFAQMPGTITAKYADVGQQVVKGQVLAQVDDEALRKQLEGLETQYKFTTDLFEKQQRLWDQKIGSEVQYLQAKTAKEALEQQILSLKKQIEMYKIVSPIDGAIEECNIKVGSVVSPDPRMAAYRVVAFKNIKVTAEVSEAYSAKVKKGDKLLVQFPDINKELETKVDFASKYINPINRTFIIETRINESVSNFKANMVAIIKINDYHTDNAITIPMNVIQKDQAGSYVYVIRAKDNYSVASKQPITLGNGYNGIVEVVEGLKVGDKVVSTGYQNLIDNEYVRF